MIVERFEPARHLEMVHGWCRARGIPEYEYDLLSPLGFVVDGHAAVWLFCTDSAMAYVDCAISAPDKHEDRVAAFMAIIEAVASTARALGYRRLVAYASDQMAPHAESFGFVRIDGRPYHGLIRSL